MYKKFILITLLLTSMMHSLMAATVTTNKATYTTTDQVHVHFANMTAKNQDWIGIYPQGSNNDWGNVVGWKWTDDKTAGDLTFGNGALPVGAYEVRAFYNNSFHTVATASFRVGAVGHATVTTNKTTYSTNEHVRVHFANMTGKNKDWIAIYPQGSSNAWGNVIGWKWTEDKASGDLTFGNGTLPAGAYEVRAFYNNSYHVEATTKFVVKVTNKPVEMYAKNVGLFFKYNSNSASDWIGIYKKDDSVAWHNVLKWKWLKDIEHEELVHIRGAGAGPTHIDLQSTHLYRNFNQNLPKGKYEARIFRNNSFNIDYAFEFTVK